MEGTYWDGIITAFYLGLGFHSKLTLCLEWVLCGTVDLRTIPIVFYLK